MSNGTPPRRRSTARTALPQQEPHPGSPQNPALPDPAYGVAEPLSVIFRWARVRLYDRLFDLADMQIERSAMAILGTITIRGPLRTSDLAQALGLDRSTVSRQVTAAITAGLVARDPDAKDARAAMLSLTSEGRKVQQKFAHAWHRLAMGMIADWNYQDQTELVRLLSKLTAGLEE